MLLFPCPQSLMTQALPRVFPGYFRLHYCRAKYVITPGIVLQVRDVEPGTTDLRSEQMRDLNALRGGTI